MDILDLIDQIKDGGPEAQSLIDVLTDLLRADGKSQFIRDSEHAIQTRILSEGLTVTTDVNSVGRDVIGTSQFDTLNFISGGGVVRVNSANPRQVDIPRGAGGGADCLFDFLVSSCFATLSGFTEGQTFTSLSGCTFKGYSTVNGAAVQAAIDFASTTPAVIAICGGTYAEAVTIGASQYVRFMGTGRDSVVVGGLTGASPSPTFSQAAGAHVWFRSLTIKTNHASSGSASAGLQTSGNIGELYCEDVHFIGNAFSSTAEYAINTTGSPSISSVASIINCNITGTNGLNLGAIRIQALVTGCYFANITGTSLIVCQDSLVIGNNFFTCTSPVKLAASTNHTRISNNHFSTGTTCITTVSTTALDVTINGNTYQAMTNFLDATTLNGFSSVWKWDIANNQGELTGTFILFPTSGFVVGDWQIHDNRVDTNTSTSAATLYSGQGVQLGIKWYNNTVHAGTTSSLYYAREPVDGGATQAFTGNIYFINSDTPLDIGVVACTIRFGDTAVSVARQTTGALTINATNYIEISSSGTLSFNTSGFTAGRYPVLQVTTAAITGAYLSHVNVGGVLFVQSSTGGGTAPASASFVTMASEASLTAERVLTPQSSYTLVGGVGFVDGGANSTVTATLKDLTATWDQTGAFDIQQRGGDIHIANSKTLQLFSDNIAVPVVQTASWDAATGNLAIGSPNTPNVTVNGASIAHRIHLRSISSGTYPMGLSYHSSTATSAQGAIMAIYRSRGSGASQLAVASGDLLSEFRFHGYDGTDYELSSAIRAFVDGTVGANVMPGRLSFWTTPASSNTPSERLRITSEGATTFIGISAPSTPASDSISVYEETGTDLLKAKDDNGAVYNLTHLHEVEAVMDVTSASTLVPYHVLRLPQAGSITDVRAKLGENKTNGATSSIFDVHKIVVASEDSDGQGTTIFTTQANRPTITNTHMVSSTTAPDVTTFAAGDWLAFYTDQSGTNATAATVVVTVRYT